MNVYDLCGKYPETVCWMHPVADMRFLVGLPCGSMGSEERSRCRSCGAPGGNLLLGGCTKWGGSKFQWSKDTSFPGTSCANEEWSVWVDEFQNWRSLSSWSTIELWTDMMILEGKTTRKFLRLFRGSQNGLKRPPMKSWPKRSPRAAS